MQLKLNSLHAWATQSTNIWVYSRKGTKILGSAEDMDRDSDYTISFVFFFTKPMILTAY